MRLSISDSTRPVRVTAGDVKVPEVLSPDASPVGRRLQGVSRIINAIKSWAYSLGSNVEAYSPKITTRDSLYKVIRIIERDIEQLEAYVQQMKKIEEEWEQEEFEETERQWRNR